MNNKNLELKTKILDKLGNTKFSFNGLAEIAAIENMVLYILDTRGVGYNPSSTHSTMIVYQPEDHYTWHSTMVVSDEYIFRASYSDTNVEYPLFKINNSINEALSEFLRRNFITAKKKIVTPHVVWIHRDNNQWEICLHKAVGFSKPYTVVKYEAEPMHRFVFQNKTMSSNLRSCNPELSADDLEKATEYLHAAESVVRNENQISASNIMFNYHYIRDRLNITTYPTLEVSPEDEHGRVQLKVDGKRCDIAMDEFIQVRLKNILTHVPDKIDVVAILPIRKEPCETCSYLYTISEGSDVMVIPNPMFDDVPLKDIVRSIDGIINEKIKIIDFAVGNKTRKVLKKFLNRYPDDMNGIKLSRCLYADIWFRLGDTIELEYVVAYLHDTTKHVKDYTKKDDIRFEGKTLEIELKQEKGICKFMDKLDSKLLHIVLVGTHLTLINSIDSTTAVQHKYSIDINTTKIVKVHEPELHRSGSPNMYDIIKHLSVAQQIPY